MEEKEVYTIEPCGHSVHKGEIYNKSWKKETEKNMTWEKNLKREVKKEKSNT